MDEQQKWNRLPEHGRIDLPGLAVRTLEGLSQFVVSGDLGSAASEAGVDHEGIGALGLVSGERYSLRLARDRTLFVTDDGLLSEQGWNDDGYALTDMSAALEVIEFRGSLANEVIKRGTDTPLDGGGPSAAVIFAGIDAILYRHQDAFRIHVDRGLSAYLWQWLAAIVQLMDSLRSGSDSGNASGKNANRFRTLDKVAE